MIAYRSVYKLLFISLLCCCMVLCACTVMDSSCVGGSTCSIACLLYARRLYGDLLLNNCVVKLAVSPLSSCHLFSHFSRSLVVEPCSSYPTTVAGSMRLASHSWVRHAWETAVMCKHRTRRPSVFRRSFAAVASTAALHQPPRVAAPFPPSSYPAPLIPSYTLRGKRDYVVLGVETTCDDTSLALVSSNGAILATATASQWHLLQQYKGVHPAMAARSHQQNLAPLLSHCLTAAALPPAAIDVVAVAAGPGLSPCLAAGVQWAAELARQLSCSYVGVHHILSHSLVAQLSGSERSGGLRFPHLSLVVSGGHTSLLLFLSPLHALTVGETMDDAMGEALDKAVRLLDIQPRQQEAPGAALERIAAQAEQVEVPPSIAALPPLPMPLQGREGCDFSFCGLKTALATRVQSLRDSSADGRLTAAETAHLALSFQSVCCQHLINRALAAVSLVRRQLPALDQLVLAGGVACNEQLRRVTTASMSVRGVEVCVPSRALCMDNGVMIAWMGVVQAGLGHEDSYELGYQPQWPAGRRINLATERLPIVG